MERGHRQTEITSRSCGVTAVFDESLLQPLFANDRAGTRDAPQPTRAAAIRSTHTIRAMIMATTEALAPQVSHLPRAGEQAVPEVITARNSRLFQGSGGWYFSTREKVTLGPFPAPESAEAAVADFMMFIKSAPPRVINVFKGRLRPPPASGSAASYG